MKEQPKISKRECAFCWIFPDESRGISWTTTKKVGHASESLLLTNWCVLMRKFVEWPDTKKRFHWQFRNFLETRELMFLFCRTRRFTQYSLHMRSSTFSLLRTSHTSERLVTCMASTSGRTGGLHSRFVLGLVSGPPLLDKSQIYMSCLKDLCWESGKQFWRWVRGLHWRKEATFVAKCWQLW